MTAVTGPTTFTRPATGRRSARPDATRTALSPRHVALVRPAACRVTVDEPSWQLTQRGLMVAMALVVGVLGSAIATCVWAFLSVSNLPL